MHNKYLFNVHEVGEGEKFVLTLKIFAIFFYRSLL